MGGIQDLVGRKDVAENSSWIGGGVAPRLFSDQRKGSVFRSVTLLIFQPGAPEKAQRHRAVGGPQPGFARIQKIAQRVRAIIINARQGAALHLFEAQCQHAVSRTAGDGLSREPEGGRTGRAIIVDVDDRNAAQPAGVKRSLAGCAVAIDIADIGLLDRWISHARVRQHICNGVRRHHTIITGLAGRVKGGHRHTGNDHGAGHDTLL